MTVKWLGRLVAARRLARVAAAAFLALFVNCKDGPDCTADPTGPTCPDIGSIVVATSGLPASGLNPLFSLLAFPSGNVRAEMTGPGKFADLPVGDYRVVSSPAVGGSANPTLSYSPSSATVDVSVSRGRTANANFLYTQDQVGAVRFDVLGIQAGASGAMTYTSPNGSGTRGIQNGTNYQAYAQPGAWTFTPQPFSAGGLTYVATPASLPATVTVGNITQIGPFTYAPLAVTIATESPLQDGTVGALYSQTLAATGGTGTYAWSVVGGALPAGLSLNANTGAVTGTPTTAGTSNFTVQAASGVRLSSWNQRTPAASSSASERSEKV